MYWRVPYFGGRVCPIFGQEKYEFLSRTVSTLVDKKSSNKFYINISVVGIPYIYLLSSFILSLINVYTMGCALSTLF